MIIQLPQLKSKFLTPAVLVDINTLHPSDPYSLLIGAILVSTTQPLTSNFMISITVQGSLQTKVLLHLVDFCDVLELQVWHTRSHALTE